MDARGRRAVVVGVLAHESGQSAGCGPDGFIGLDGLEGRHGEPADRHVRRFTQGRRLWDLKREPEVKVQVGGLTLDSVGDAVNGDVNQSEGAGVCRRQSGLFGQLPGGGSGQGCVAGVGVSAWLDPEPEGRVVDEQEVGSLRTGDHRGCGAVTRCRLLLVEQIDGRVGDLKCLDDLRSSPRFLGVEGRVGGEQSQDIVAMHDGPRSREEGDAGGGGAVGRADRAGLSATRSGIRADHQPADRWEVHVGETDGRRIR